MKEKKQMKVSHNLSMSSCSNHAIMYWLNFAVMLAIFLCMRSLQASAQNTAPTQATRTEAQVDFGPYMADLQRRIKRDWFPPRGQESRRVSVIFKIGRNGELSKLRLDKSCGNGVADAAALRAVETAAPFKPLPVGSPDNVDIKFTFDYNVWNKGRPNPVQPPVTAYNDPSPPGKFEQNCHTDDWVLYAFGGALAAFFALAATKGARSRENSAINLKSPSTNHKPRL